MTAEPESAVVREQVTPPRGGLDASHVFELCARYNRWGRWGSDDELGALNLITPDVVAAASRLVQSGRVVSCALPYDDKGPQTGAFGRTNPIHFMLQTGGDIAVGAQNHLNQLRYTDDAVYMPLQCGTQWDALAHIFHEGRMYNGYGLSEVTARGASKNGIDVAANRVVGRGVLLDIPRHRGVSWLEPGDGIGGDELAACAAAQDIVMQPGDIVLVRTGQMTQARSEGSWGTYAAGDAPGLAISAAPWLCDHEVAAVATDTWGAEVLPNETSDVFQPLHLILLVNAGMLIGEIFDLDPLAAACADEQRWKFFFVANPLPFTGAVGSPLNPTAIF